MINIDNKKIKKVSIILPTYNGWQYLKESIDSCLNQTYRKIELIIVDDGSLENIKKIIQSYSDDRIIYIRHKKNLGLANALNSGFLNTSGEYLTWTSDDNFYDFKAIQNMVKVLEKNPEIDFIYTNYYTIDEEGKKIKPIKIGSVKGLDRCNCIGPCFLYRRKIYEKIGEYNPNFFLAEDYEYWLKIRKQFKMQKLNQFLYFYREHKDRLTTNYKIAIIEEQVEKASQEYVSEWAKYYHKGRVYLFKKDYKNSIKFFMKAFILNPFNFFIWRMLAFSFLGIISPSFAEKLRNFNIKK
jgi:glycosyltransferase involved in cell wall biosynthesis